MKLEIVDFETAKDLKELGFDWDCYLSVDEKYPEDIHIAYDLTGENKFTIEDIEAAKENGHNCFLMPELDLVCKWFRDVYDIYITCTIIGVYRNSNHQVSVVDFSNDSFGDRIIYKLLENMSYDEAQLEGIKETIKYLKSNETTKTPKD